MRPPPARIDSASSPIATRILDELRPARVGDWPAILQNVTLPDVAEQVAFDAGKYTRTLLAGDEHAELLVMGWLPGQASAIHDHGASEGAALVLAGEAHEENFVTDAGVARRTGERIVKRGQWTIERATDVHRVRNAGTQLLVTLHAYRPRLEEYRTYEPA